MQNIDKVKLASEASQENFAFLATKYGKNSKIRTLGPSKSGGGAKTHLNPPTFERGGGHMPPPVADPGFQKREGPLLFFCFAFQQKGGGGNFAKKKPQQQQTNHRSVLTVQEFIKTYP